MAWLIAIAILIVAGLFAAGLRKPALALGLGVLIAGVSIYVYNERQERQETTRITASEIGLENVELRPTFRSSYDFVGTLKNKSEQYRIDGIDITVTLRDCSSKDKTSCTVIGQASGYTGIAVPPQASRDLVVSLHFGGDQPRAKGHFAWDYAITAITAKRQ